MIEQAELQAWRTARRPDGEDAALLLATTIRDKIRLLGFTRYTTSTLRSSAMLCPSHIHLISYLASHYEGEGLTRSKETCA